MMLRFVASFHMCLSAISLHVHHRTRSCDQPFNENESGGHAHAYVSGYPTHENVTYWTSHGVPLKLDIYIPCPEHVRESKMPAMLYFHEGGWQEGDKNFVSKAAFKLLTEGIALVSVQYRLTEEFAKWSHGPDEGWWEKFTWPAQGEDSANAATWLKSNAATYSINPDKVGCWGDSAGGQICAWLASAGSLQEETRMTVAVDNFGINCFFCEKGSPQSALVQRAHTGDFLNDSSKLGADDFYFLFPQGRMAELQKLRTLALASNKLVEDVTDDQSLLEDFRLVQSADPIYQVQHVSKGNTSPMFVGHGAEDAMVPPFKSAQMAAHLQQSNVEHEYMEVPGGGHSYSNWPEEAIDRAVGFASRLLFKK